MFHALLTPFGAGTPDALESRALYKAGGLGWYRGRPLRDPPELSVDVRALARPLPAILPNVGAVPILSRALVDLLDGARMECFPVTVTGGDVEYLAVNLLDRLKKTVDLDASDVTVDPLSTVATFLEGFRRLVLDVEDPPPAFRIQAFSSIVVLREDVGRRVVDAALPGCVCLPLEAVHFGPGVPPDRPYIGL